MSAGVQAIPIHKRLVLDKRENSDNWYARLSLADGGNIRRSTKTANLELAKEIALKIYYETEARIEKEPAQGSICLSPDAKGHSRKIPADAQLCRAQA